MQEQTNNKTEGKDKPNPNIGASKPKSSLASALMRTFKGDITKELGDEAPEIVEQLVPGSPPLQEQSSIDTNSTVHSDTKEAETKSKPDTKPKSILRTYKGDVQSLVRRKKLSLMRMAAAEVDQKSGQKYAIGKKIKPENSTGLLLLLLALIALGVVALGGVYYTYILRAAPTPHAPKHQSLIFTDKIETVDTTGKIPHVLKQELTAARNGAYYSPGSVAELLLIELYEDQITQDIVSTTLNTREILEALGVTNANAFAKVFQDKAMLGLYASEENVPFIILQTDIYDYAFEKMLLWEDSIESDLAPLFSPRGRFGDLDTFSAESAFSDTVVNNLDVRVLRDKDKKARLLYSFVNKNTLVITTSIPALIELSGRLRSAQ